MIAVSSIRPFEGNPEYARNQWLAWESWQSAFASIVYFSSPEPALRSPKTLFVDWEPFPRIIDLAEFLASQSDWGCIINADIVVAKSFRLIEKRLKIKQGSAAASWRYEFDPARGLDSARRVENDNGLDFFAAVPEVWRKVYENVDPDLRLGAQFWDTWTLSFFNLVAAHGFYDLTPHKLIFHPKHEGRKYGPGMDHRKVSILHWPTMPSVTV